MAKILVVDDSSTVRDEVAGFLRKNGLEVDTAVDGKDGLAKLKTSPGIKLVVSDVNMPNMDGLTMVEKIRSELGNAAVNVVMLTTESSPAMKERGKAAGVRGWIVKPFRGEAVLDTFRKLAS
ncbi:response regulator [Burkholderia sp. 22PA0099]|uniref:response regulator n=1 Tax=unclassified Burkholderia TaxID=2613784 RepID=UPI0039C1B0FA